MHRLLFVGVGGSGGSVLRYAWHEIDMRLRDRDPERPAHLMPASFHFLHFDLPESFDGYSKDKGMPRVEELDKSYRGLAEKNLRYSDYDRTLVADGQMNGMWGWRPHPVDDIPDPFVGAGQRRSVGRAVTIASLATIDNAIDAAATQLTSTAATQGLADVEALFNLDEQATSKPGHVFLVGSLAGGSGSGMFLDVLERVKAHALPWFSNIHLVAITPDAFLGVPEAEREGNEPNAFAAMNEYLSAFYWQGPLHRHEAAIQATAGAVGGNGRRTGDRAFLIGRGNESVSFEFASDLMRCVGTSLAAYATTPAIQNYFDTVVCNLNGSASRPGVFFAERGQSPLQPVGSFGFGSVSVGGKRLGEYGAQRLALGCLRRLLCDDIGNQAVDDYVASRTDILSCERFFDASGLWEYDPKRPSGSGPVTSYHDQVLDKLRDAKDVLDGAGRVAADTISRLVKDKRGLEAKASSKEFNDRFEERARVFETNARDARSERAKAWTADVQARLVEATLDVACRDGIPVAVELLRLLMQQVDNAAAQLEEERAKCAAREADAYGRAGSLYLTLKGKIVGTAEVHRESANYRHAALYQRIEAHAREQAGELLLEARESLIVPIYDWLSGLASTLADERRDLNGPGSQASLWPDHAVPQGLLPAENERMLRTAKAMPTDLDALLCQTTGLEQTADAFSGAVQEVLRGGWPDARHPGVPDSGGESLMQTRRTWNSKHEFAQREGAAAAADFHTAPGLIGVLDRTREWVAFRRGALSERVGETLVQYLDPAVAGSRERLRSFVTEFGIAGTCAQPLIAIDDRVRKLVHGDTTESSYTMTPLPFAEGHPARGPLEKALVVLGVEPQNTGQYFTTDPGGREIEIFGFMSKSVHPVVISSLMDPIASAWSQAAGSREGRAQFSSFRRAHTLEMAIGLPPSQLRTLVRGWYVAAMLGYLAGLDATRDTEPAPRVWSPDGWLPFPGPLLGDPVTKRQDLLPAVLESFPLRLLEVSLVPARMDDAYSRLLALGGGTARTEDGPADYSELLGWLETGSRPDGAPKPPAIPGAIQKDVDDYRATTSRRGASRTAAHEARRKAAVKALNPPRTTYSPISKVVADESVFEPDRRWEIAPLVLRALGELEHFINTAELKGGASTSDLPEPTDI